MPVAGALEGSCKDTPVLPRQKVKDTRIALVEHFREGRFVHPAALFAPDKAAVSSWLAKNAVAEDDAADDQVEDPEAGGPRWRPALGRRGVPRGGGIGRSRTQQSE